MITIEQCRAARGLLGWTQQDLAESSGLSKTAINNFEKGHSDIKNESLRAIRMAFESADIEFTGDNGLRMKSETAQILKGETAFEKLQKDIEDTMKGQDGEVLVSNPENESGARSLENLNGNAVRILCSAGTRPRLGSAECRWLPANTTGMTTFIYGHKIALSLWDRSMIVVVNSREASDAERRRFEILWSSAAPASAGNNNATNAGKVRGI